MGYDNVMESSTRDSSMLTFVNATYAFVGLPPAGAPKCKKAGKGFYDWGPDGKALWSELAKLYPTAAQQPEQRELIDRLLFAQANEAARCYQEGVLRSVADGNFVVVDRTDGRQSIIAEVDYSAAALTLYEGAIHMVQVPSH